MRDIDDRRFSRTKKEKELYSLCKEYALETLKHAVMVGITIFLRY